MEYLSEEHAKLLLAKEWLVKVDNDTSTPYLFKFYASKDALTCLIVITDTKSVWGEVLGINQFSRRWRDCNPKFSADLISQNEESAWGPRCLQFLSEVHSLGGVADLAFELVKSNYSDLAFELRNDTFRWRWEAFNVGPRLSADILSKHLIMPLISATHLSFLSADPVNTTSEADIEKSTDRVGRIARRAVDNHVKNTLSKPLIATTLRRMSAVLNFVPDPPRIVVDVQAPDLQPPKPSAPRPVSPKPPLDRAASPQPTVRASVAAQESKAKASAPLRSLRLPQDDDESVTEEEPDEDEILPVPNAKGKGITKDHRRPDTRSSSPARSVPSKRATPDQSTRPTAGGSPSRSARDSSSPLPEPKKTKRPSAVSSSGDSEPEQKGRGTAVKSGARRGVKQPIKRGGRRF